MHVVTLFNEKYKSGDEGGNFIKLLDQDGYRTNLHKIWDDLFKEYEKLYRPLTNWGQKRLEEIADEIMSEFPKEYFSKELEVIILFSLKIQKIGQKKFLNMPEIIFTNLF